MFEVRIKEKTNWFFSDWKEYTYMRRAASAQEELLGMVQTLEMQLGAVNKQGAIEIMMQLFKRDTATSMTYAFAKFRENVSTQVRRHL